MQFEVTVSILFFLFLISDAHKRFVQSPAEAPAVFQIRCLYCVVVSDILVSLAALRAKWVRCAVLNPG